MILNRTAAPSALVTTADAKAALRVDYSDDDTLIDGYIAAAAEALDGPYGKIGKALLTQTRELKREPITGRNALYFPAVPLQSVSSMSYFDKDNASQSLTVGDFTIYSEEDKAWIVPDIGTNWPVMYDRPDALTVTFVAGFGASSDVPENIMVAAKQLVAHMHEHRGDEAVDMPAMVEPLSGVSRLGWFG